MNPILLATIIAVAQPRGKNFIVLKTYAVTGQFVGFESNTYTYAILKDETGKEHVCLAGSAGITYFLAAHAKKPGVFTLQLTDAYLSAESKRRKVIRLASATIGGTANRSWWEAERKRLPIDKLNEKYQPWVANLTRLPKLG